MTVRQLSTPEIIEFANNVTKQKEVAAKASCPLYPQPIDEHNDYPNLRATTKRVPNDGKSIDDWLLKQRMTNESLYRNQEVLDSDIIRLEAQMRNVQGRMRWLEVAVVCLVISCGGLTLCLL